MDIYCIDMPKHAIDYQKAKIYKICCKDVNITDVYVGSTTNMSRRKSEHKGACNNRNGTKYNFNVYRFIRENGGWANWSMIVVEDFPCDNKHELETRERFHIEDLHSILNKFIPTRTRKEWVQHNAEKIKDYQNQYHIDNSEKVKEQTKQYRVDNSEEIKERNKQYRLNNVERIKEYRKEVREKKKVYNKEYRKNKSAEIKACATEKIECPHCNNIFSRASMTVHIRRKHTEQTHLSK